MIILSESFDSTHAVHMHAYSIPPNILVFNTDILVCRLIGFLLQCHDTRVHAYVYVTAVVPQRS